MKLVLNPSYKHSKEFVDLFRRYSSNIFYKDFTQYSNDLLAVTLFSIEKGKEFGLKTSELLWLTKFVYELNLTKEQVEYDYLPVLKSYVINKSKLNPIETYKSIGELNSHIESLSDSEEFVSEKDLDIFFEKDGWILAMPHTTEASCLLGKQTEWCTARTKSQNLFLSYVGRYKSNIVLFYVIKIDGNPKKNPNDKLSVGFINGKPVFDGKDGGLTVNAKNDGFSIEQFGKILGKELAKEMLIEMDEKSQSIKGKHPAKKEMERIAKSADKYLKKISEFKNEDELNDFKEEVAKYPVNEEVAIILSEDKHGFFIINLASNKSITEKIQIKLSEKESLEVRKYLAQNPSLTEKVQMKLTDDESQWIRGDLAQNTSLTEKVQIKLSEDKDEWVREWLARNTSITEKVQMKLSEDKDKSVRQRLAQNPSLTESTLIKLSKDNDEGIRPFVLNLLNKRHRKDQ